MDSLFTVNRDGEFGQHLVASRHIPAGTVIVQESPAFYGPSADYVQDYSTPLCVGCAVVMNSGNEHHRCSACAWPLCGPNCEKLSYHADYECNLFAKEKVPFPPSDLLPIQNCYKGLTILRGLLLREKEPELWEKVMDLQYENEIEEPNQAPDLNEFRTLFGLPNFSSPEDWARILGLLNVNSYSIQRVEKTIGSPTFAEFVYCFQCRMNHSCSPNCHWSITYSPTFQIIVKASVDLKKGEHLSVTYNYDLSKYGVHKRQQKIREQARFSCKCTRCLDSTDFGTWSGGVLCFKCGKGFMLPLSPGEPESEWKCDKCPYSMCSSFVDSFVCSLAEQVEMAEQEGGDEEVVDVLEDFISENSGTTLHPNHWVLTLAAQSIINHQSKRLGELGSEQLDKVVELLKHVLKIKDAITPGISTDKGILQHHYARAMFAKLKTSEDPTKERAAVLTGQEELEIKRVYKLQKSAECFWRENCHYGTLHMEYKGDATLLLQEMEQIKSKYPFVME